MRPAASRLPGRAHIRTSSSPSWAAPGRAACLRGPGKHLQVSNACTLCQRRCGAERRGEGRSRLQFANALQTADNCRSHSPWQEGAEQQVSYSTCVPPPCRSERLMSEPRGRCWESNVCVAGGHRTLATPPPALPPGRQVCIRDGERCRHRRRPTSGVLIPAVGRFIARKSPWHCRYVVVFLCTQSAL